MARHELDQVLDPVENPLDEALLGDPTPQPASSVVLDRNSELDTILDKPFVPTGMDALSPSQRRLDRSLKRQLRTTEHEYERKVGEPVKEPKFKGLWWVVDQMDRPRNALHNALLAYRKGDTNWEGIRNAAWKGLRGQERANFEDLFETLTFNDQMAMMTPLLRLGISIPTAKKILGFGGDVVVDPLNVIPIGKIAKALRIGKGAGAAMRAFGRVTKTDEVIKVAFGRSTGIRELDGILDRKIDIKRYIESGLMREAEDISKLVTPLRKEHKGLVSRLAEEIDIDRIESFARRIRAGGLDPEAAEDVIWKARAIQNRDAVRELISIRDPEMFDLALEGVRRIQPWFVKLRQAEAMEGKVVGTLGGQLEKMLRHTDRLVLKEARRIATKARAEAAKQVELGEATVGAQKKLLQEMLGKGKWKQFENALKELRAASAEVGIAGQKRPRPTQKQIFEEYVKGIESLFENIHPGLMAGVREVSRSKAAIPGFFEEFQRKTIQFMGDSDKLKGLVAEHDKILQTMENVPSYVPHVASIEALDAMARTGGPMARFKAAFKTPATARDLVRRFQEEGRPLSLEEVEAVIRGEKPLGGRVRLLEGPVYKTTWIDRLMDRPGQMANFFETDERIILGTAARQNAQAVSVAKYLNEANGIFGRNADEVRDATGRIKKEWSKLSTLPEGERIVQMMPHLKDRYFQNDVVRHIAGGIDRFTNPEAAGKVLRIYDNMLNWWISMTLPAFPAFHTRNIISNFFNMSDAGFNALDPRDMMLLPKTSALQMFHARNNVEAAKRLTFHVKHLNTNINGHEATQEMLKRGIVDNGWFGGQLDEAIGRQIDSIWRSPGSYMPWSKNNVVVRGGMAGGRALENGQRGMLFLSRLAKGDTFDEAAMAVKKFLGDYRTEVMTPFEREGLKRIFPFYRWFRFNVPLQFEQMLTSNRKRAKLLALYRGRELGQQLIGGAPVELEPADLPPKVPDWIKESAGTPVRRDPETGEVLFWIMENWMPAADIGNFLPIGTEETRRMSKFVGEQVSPFITKGLVEFPLGISYFLNRDVKDQPPGEFLFWKQIDPELVNHLRGLRFLSEMDRLDPFGAFHKRRTQPPLNERVLRFFGVAPIFRVNLAREELRYNQELLRKMRMRIGVANRVAAIEREEEEKED